MLDYRQSYMYEVPMQMPQVNLLNAANIVQLINLNKILSDLFSKELHRSLIFVSIMLFCMMAQFCYVCIYSIAYSKSVWEIASPVFVVSTFVDTFIYFIIFSLILFCSVLVNKIDYKIRNIFMGTMKDLTQI